MNEQERPSPSHLSRSLLLVGKNSRGQWVVRNRSGSRGGLFVDRAQALKFAMFESGRQPEAVIMVPGVLELDMSGCPDATTLPASTMQLLRAA